MGSELGVQVRQVRRQDRQSGAYDRVRAERYRGAARTTSRLQSATLPERRTPGPGPEAEAEPLTQLSFGGRLGVGLTSSIIKYLPSVTWWLVLLYLILSGLLPRI